MMLLQPFSVTVVVRPMFASAASTVEGAKPTRGKKYVTLDHGRRCYCRTVAGFRLTPVV